MPTLLLVRHGRSTANADGVLAGRTADVHLDDDGHRQAAALGARLAVLNLAAVITSPLERCRETANAITDAQPGVLDAVADVRLVECGYGDWTGRELKRLSRERLWKAVQQHPSGVRFPGPEGESLRSVQHRGVESVREWDGRVAADHGPDAVWVAVTHGDVLGTVLADALGLHLDHYQRIVCDPGSVSVVRYTPLRPFVLRLNDTSGDLSGFRPARRRRRRPRASDAVPGGATGG